ncbi:unnamed protein product [Parascedosporium putredinis]|uniref:PH domain-containing protein n=1 Tax=Parascedosporium putredinis TaxID=1442378 RepID=A0A9P1GY65_9PEZI|nr:unnamed protein product [Parascedosporium putredinis]CAI7989876.1 unnamed protein product [Parascedosporium putredinis]
MQKQDYLKNAGSEGIFDEILECFYDNITYTPFIHVEDDLDINGDRIIAHKARRKPIFAGGAVEVAKNSSKEPIDPYTLIIDGKLDALRPSLKDVMHLDDYYTYVGTAKSLNLKELQRTFFRTGLYFFRNTAWVKGLMHQYEAHIRQGNDGIPVTFKPPLEQFKPDVLFSTDGAVALVDSAYKKHKNAFVYVRHGSVEEVLLADDEDEMNDWLAKLNYAAAFRTSGVRMRGVVGGHYEGQSRRGIRRLDNADATQLIRTPTGDVSIARGQIDHKMAEDILAARRDIMQEKIADAADKLTEVEKQLETQLRNARHLQILAPIQTKTREQVLLAAARISAQLKWTRMEIWKLRCHRDILLQDLEEERVGLGLERDVSPGETLQHPAVPPVAPVVELPTSTGNAGAQPISDSRLPSKPDPLSDIEGKSLDAQMSITPPRGDIDDGERDLLEKAGLLDITHGSVLEGQVP